MCPSFGIFVYPSVPGKKRICQYKHCGTGMNNKLKQNGVAQSISKKETLYVPFASSSARFPGVTQAKQTQAHNLESGDMSLVPLLCRAVSTLWNHQTTSCSSRAHTTLQQHRFLFAKAMTSLGYWNSYRLGPLWWRNTHVPERRDMCCWCCELCERDHNHWTSFIYYFVFLDHFYKPKYASSR